VTGMVVCLLTADRGSNFSLVWALDGHIVRWGTVSSSHANQLQFPKLSNRCCFRGDFCAAHYNASRRTFCCNLMSNSHGLKLTSCGAKRLWNYSPVSSLGKVTVSEWTALAAVAAIARVCPDSRQPAHCRLLDQQRRLKATHYDVLVDY